MIGEFKNKLIHIGRTVLDSFVNTVFNYAMLAECYKTAAFNGINRLA